VTADAIPSARQDGRSRCPWAWSDPALLRYHDEEWGVPVTAANALLEFLVLEGAQAGLSWRTVLQKRTAYRQAFHQFDPAFVAGMTPDAIDQLMQNPGLIRNRAKLAAAVVNARQVLAITQASGSWPAYLWSLAGGRPVVNHWRTPEDVPTATPVSHAMSRALKQHGFQFVGPTICYAFMQATGMVMDHLVGCFRHAELAKAANLPVPGGQGSLMLPDGNGAR